MSAALLPLGDAFPLVRYRLHGIVERGFEFADFAASALRGAFGHALRASACVTGLSDCSACALYRSCVYPLVFETPKPAGARAAHGQLPNPYVIEPLDGAPRAWRPGQAFAFDFVLIGPALAHLPLIALAWRNALARDIGRQGRVRLERVTLESGDVVLDLAAGYLHEHDQRLMIPAAPANLHEVDLEFITPLLLARGGHEREADELTPQDLLMTLVRRTANMVETHLGQRLEVDFSALKTAAAQIADSTRLRGTHWRRHSARQQRDMPMGGLVGRWRLRGELAPFWPYLYLGQWLHVGKKCSFGQGRYRLHIGQRA